MQGEASESTDLDPLSGCQCTAHLLQQGLDRELYVLFAQRMLLCRHVVDQVGFSQCCSSPVERDDPKRIGSPQGYRA